MIPEIQRIRKRCQKTFFYQFVIQMGIEKLLDFEQDRKRSEFMTQILGRVKTEK